MARARLDYLDLDTLGNVQGGKTVTIYEIDGSTLLAQTMYDAPAGGSVVPNPLVTDANGQAEAYVTTPQRVKAKPQGGVARTTEFFPDGADIATLAATQTFTASTFENLSEGLVDHWSGNIAQSPAAGYGVVGLARGSGASPPDTRGAPLLFMQDRIYQNQDGDRQLPATAFVQTEYYGANTVAQRTITAGSLASTSISLNDNAAGNIFTPGALVGQQVTLLAGTGTGQYRRITANTASALTVDPAWTVTPVAGSTQYAINRGGAPQTAGLLVNVWAHGSSTPWPSPNASGQEHIGVMSYARRLVGTSNVYGALLSAQGFNALANVVGLEIDQFNSSGVAAAKSAVGSAPNVTFGINMAGFGANNNTVGWFLQSEVVGSYYRGVDFSYNSIASYVDDPDPTLTVGLAIDFAKLAGATTTPKLIRAGSGHAILLGRKANPAAGDVDLLTWVSDVLALQADTVKLNNEAGTNYGTWDATGLTITGAGKKLLFNGTNGSTNHLLLQSATSQTTNLGLLPGTSGGTGTMAMLHLYNNPVPASGQELQVFASTTGVAINSNASGLTGAPQVFYLEVSGTPVISMDVTKLAFFNGTPVVKQATLTQTYATAEATLANNTSAALTGITSSTTGTALAEPGGGYVQADMQQNFRRIQDQLNAVIVDLLDHKQFTNSIATGLKAYGLFG